MLEIFSKIAKKKISIFFSFLRSDQKSIKHYKFPEMLRIMREDVQEIYIYIYFLPNKQYLLFFFFLESAKVYTLK